MYLLSFIIAIIATVSLSSGCTAIETNTSILPPPKPLPAPLSVLVIGDSNTEIGHITGETARLMESDYGYSGSGYHSLHAKVGTGNGFLPGLKIRDDGKWHRYEMVPANAAAPKPFLSPDGTGARSVKAGAKLTVEFYGCRADIYWLASPDGGAFSLAVDERAPQRIETSHPTAEVRRTRVDGLETGWHTLTATVETGQVMLLGVDAWNEATTNSRAVVHKWGKGWAATEDFLAIEPMVFQSALQLLNPDIVVVLLGTNDHNLRAKNRDQFAENLTAITWRVRAALPAARVLLVSTAQVNSGWSNLSLAQYVEVMPEVARETGAQFWDLSTWFGPWKASIETGLMADGVHVNAAGGAKIAAELYPVLKQLAAQSAPAPLVETAEKLKVHGASSPDALPAKMKGLLAWWSADGPVALDSENRVARWDSAGAEGASALQRRAQWRPLWVPGVLNDRAVVRFDGKHQYLQFPLQKEIRTVVFVARTNVHGRPLFGHPHFNTRPFSPATKIRNKLLSSQYASAALTKGEAYLNGERKEVGDDSAAAIGMTQGAFQIVSLIATAPVGAAYLGWGGSWNLDKYFDGDFVELLFFNRALEETERLQVESYLRDKYALTQ